MVDPIGCLLPSGEPAQEGENAPPLPVGEVHEIALPLLLSEVYRTSPPSMRARLLECLLRPLRPLGLAAGAFGSFLHRERWSSLSVPVEEVARYSAEQVCELAPWSSVFVVMLMRASLSRDWLGTLTGSREQRSDGSMEDAMGLIGAQQA